MKIIQTLQQFDELCSELAKQKEVVLDVETDGLDVWRHNRICGVGLDFADGRAFYVPLRHKEFAPGMELFAALLDSSNWNIDLEHLPRLWASLQKVKKICGHNIKFDLAACHQDGYVVPDGQAIEDTLCGARIWFKDKDPDMSLEGITRDVLGEDEAEWKQRFKNYLTERGIKNHYDRGEPEVVGEYCMTDCRNTRRARDKFEAYAEATGQSFIYEMERDLMNVLWDIEREGLRLDIPYIKQAIQNCQKACDQLMDMIEQLIGERLNPWSVPQITSAMESVGQKALSLTPTGLASWTDDVLQRVKHPLGKLILSWRKIDKMRSTFFEPYLAYGTEYVHPRFKSWGAVTGRFSCEDPNLQQVSRPTDWKKEGLPEELEWFDVQVRRMFIAPDDYYFVMADYSQMEMIGYADYIEDENLRAKLNEAPIDFHALVAQMIWNIPEDDPEFKTYRSQAKSISLGLVYMMGIDKLARSLGMDEDGAKELRSLYFRNFPTAPDFISKVTKTIEQRGYIFNRFGRRYYVDADWSYKGINYLVQGTCADIIKQKMIALHKMFKGTRSRLAFQMHDEFGFYIHKDEWRLVRHIIEIMELMLIKTKLFVDVSVGLPSWDVKGKVCKVCLERDVQKDHACGPIIEIPQDSSADFIDPETGRKIPSYGN